MNITEAIYDRAYTGLLDHLGIRGEHAPEIQDFAIECISQSYSPGDPWHAEAIYEAAEDVAAMHGITVEQVMGFAPVGSSVAVAA